MKETNKSLIGMGVLSAVAASLCCITPVLALLSGATGIASTFSWIEPARPYFVAMTIGVLGFAWYLKLKPRPNSELQCACEENGSTPFIQSRSFLTIVTIVAALLLAFPYYAHRFFPSNNTKEVIVLSATDIQKVTFLVQGMTCGGCESHVENEVNHLPGIVSVDANHQDGTTQVAFDQSKVSLVQIEKTINGTGYKVVGTK